VNEPAQWFLDPVHVAITMRLFAAVLVGGLIGLERSYLHRKIKSYGIEV